MNNTTNPTSATKMAKMARGADQPMLSMVTAAFADDGGPRSERTRQVETVSVRDTMSVRETVSVRDSVIVKVRECPVHKLTGPEAVPGGSTAWSRRADLGILSSRFVSWQRCRLVVCCSGSHFPPRGLS